MDDTVREHRINGYQFRLVMTGEEDFKGYVLFNHMTGTYSTGHDEPRIEIGVTEAGTMPTYIVYYDRALLHVACDAYSAMRWLTAYMDARLATVTNPFKQYVLPQAQKERAAQEEDHVTARLDYDYPDVMISLRKGDKVEYTAESIKVWRREKEEDR
jgi:hypothetical protein